MDIKKRDENCSWEEVYTLNGVTLNNEESFDSIDLDEIDSIVVGYSSPLKPILRFGIPEILIER